MKKLTAAQKANGKKRALLTLQVLKRAENELPGFDKRDRMSNMMDLESLNEGDIVMDWKKLLQAPAFDFAHDMYGIRRHMVRTSWPGKLGGCFLPRCAMSEKELLKAGHKAVLALNR